VGKYFFNFSIVVSLFLDEKWKRDAKKKEGTRN
jgi:hypothetical protein